MSLHRDVNVPHLHCEPIASSHRTRTIKALVNQRLFADAIKLPEGGCRTVNRKRLAESIHKRARFANF